MIEVPGLTTPEGGGSSSEAGSFSSQGISTGPTRQEFPRSVAEERKVLRQSDFFSNPDQCHSKDRNVRTYHFS